MLKAIHKKYLSHNKTKLSKITLKNGKRKVFRCSKTIPIVSGLTLAGVLTVSGFIPATWISSASAAEQSSNGTAAYSGNLNLTANVTEPGLSVTLPNGSSATLNLAPPFSGYDDTSASVLVRVGSHNKYKLYMSGDTSLKNSSDSSNATIPTLDTTSCSSGCNFSSSNFSNAWGYAIGANSDSYYGLKTAASLLASDTTTVVGGNEYRDYTIKFGAKVDHTVTPGTYTGTVNFIAVADVNSNLYMQYMTSDQCTTTASTVYDVRDGKSYKIQKLADNKCWMLDNLALDPTNSNTIVNEYNTNASATTLAILKNGVYNETTNPSGVNLEGTGLDNTSGKYASSGIMANPNTAATYPYWGKSNTESSNNCVAGDTNPTTGCTDNWTVPRVNTSKMNTQQAQAWGSDANYPSYGSYNIGVYYNYCAASAGSYCYGAGNAPNTDARATEDICPSGWRLPTSGTINTTTGNGEFQALYDAYDSTAVGSVNGYTFRATLSTPLSGHVLYQSAAIDSVGMSGDWWSSTWSSGNNMYNMYMTTTNINPKGGYYRSGGFPVRCVLQ